jgi:vesicle-associated membrane protein 7
MSNEENKGETGTIRYSVVSRGTTVLAEQTSSKSNASTVAARILAKIPTEDGMMSYAYEKYMFNYIVEGGICYLCMTDEAMQRRIAFSFLQDVKGRWLATYGSRGIQAPAYGMQDEFGKVLLRQMKHFSSNAEADKLNRVKNQVEEVKTIMTQNIDSVLQRGERIELLVDKSEDLSANASRFKKGSTALKRAMWWKNVKLTLLILLIVGLVILFIVWLACGVSFERCKSDSK